MEVTKEETDVTFNRERGIGGSDIPAIMGISPFTTRFDLLMYKAGIKENDFNGNEYTEFGNELEPKIRKHINDTFGFNFKPSYIACDEDEPLSCYYHSDGYDPQADMLLEIKTTSKIARELDAADKGISFYDYSMNFYQKYIVQLLYGMWINHCKEGYLAVYERPDDMNTEFMPSRLAVFDIEVDKHKELMDKVLDAVANFRSDFVYLCEHPWAEELELPSRSSLMPIATKLMALETYINQAQETVKQYDDLKKQMCKAMQEHGIKSWMMANGTKVTLVPKGEDKVVQEFNEEKFKEEHGDLYAEYQNDRIKKGRSAYVRVTPVAKGEKA